MDCRVDAIVDRLGLDRRTPEAQDVRALAAFALELGATDDEIIRAGGCEALGPLTIDYALRPPGEVRSLEAFEATSGLDPALVRRLWLAFGLPEVGVAPPVVTPDVAQAIRTLAALAGTVGEDAALGTARIIGSSSAQLAAALANASRVAVEVPQLDSGVPYAEVVVEMTRVVRDLLPPLWDAVGAVFRRHLVVVSYQAWTPDVARTAITVTRTVGFVDLTGSTDALRKLSVAEVAASVNRFEQLVGDLVTRAGGRVVKLIGDEAMFVIEDPIAACSLAGELVATSPQPVRIGLAHGEMIAFHGDFYGPTVNLAARLVAVAQPATILADESLAAATDGLVALEPVGTGPLRGFPDVTIAYRVVEIR